MEDSKEQLKVGWNTAAFGIIESIVVGGILYIWASLNGFIEDFLPAVPYVLGTLLLVQLGVGLFLRTGKITQIDTVSVGKVILYSLLMTIITPPLIILVLLMFNWLNSPGR